MSLTDGQFPRNLSSVDGQFRSTVRHNVVDGLSTPPPHLTRRDVRLPAIPGKAIAVIGMRRAGKTTFLWQVLADRLTLGTPRTGLLFFGFEDVGHALETVVLLELERRGAEITYVRTANGFEVDFLARFPEGHQELIQVCAELESPETATRELRALKATAEEHPRASQHLVVLDLPAAIELPAGVVAHTASEWLLAGGRAEEGSPAGE